MDQRRVSSMMSLAGAMLLGLFFSACSSQHETMLPATAPVLSAATQTAGLNTCAGGCHRTETAGWMTSRHANAEGGLHSAGTPTLGQMAGACVACHDPLGDSGKITLAGSLGTVARPVIGCESCHGPGGLHVNAGGMGPVSRLSGSFSATEVGSVPV